MNPLGLNKNKSTIFILPMMLTDKKHSDIITDLFVNAYIADFNEPKYDDQLTIVSRTKEDGSINIERHSIPEEYLEDYFKIISGAYHDTSDKYKKKLLSFWDSSEKDKIYELLYIDNSKIRESIPPFELHNEIYNMGVPL